MKITSLNYTFIKKHSPNFTAKPQRTKDLETDTVEFSAKPEYPIPKKLQFTPLEETFYTILKERIKVEMDIKTQKENLRNYYSSDDKYEYKQLLKRRHVLVQHLRQIANNELMDPWEIESSIISKNQYNRYAPKVCRAKSMEELEDVIELINNNPLFMQTKAMLHCLINQQKEYLCTKKGS